MKTQFNPSVCKYLLGLYLLCLSFNFAQAQVLGNQADIYDLSYLERTALVDPSPTDLRDTLVCASDATGRVVIRNIPSIRVCADSREEAWRKYKAALVRVARRFGNVCLDNEECFPAECTASFYKWGPNQNIDDPEYDPQSGKWIFPARNRFIFFFNCPCVLDGVENIDFKAEQPSVGSSVALQWAPNPARDQIQLRFDLAEEAVAVEVLFHDIQGRIVYRENLGSLARGTQQEHFDLSALPEGLYFASIYLNTQILDTSSILIQR